MKAITLQCLTVTALILVLIACSKDPLQPVPVDTPIPSVGIDELLLITASTTQHPTLSTGDRHTFELAAIPIVQSGEFNDIEIQYTTTDACDEDVELFNFVSNKWDELASGPFMVCAPVITNWWRTLSERELDPDDYLDSGDRLVIRTLATPALRVLKINDGYDPIALLPLDIDASGIYVLGSTIWLASANLSRVTTHGTKQTEVTTPMDPSSGLAYDGEWFWTLDRTAGSVEVFRGIKARGIGECSFPGHDDFAVDNGMVYADSLLWAVRSGGDELLGIDLEKSCADNALRFPERLFLTTHGAVAVTYDGTDFYVAYTSTIKKVSLSGVELEDHPLMVERVIDLTYIDGALWILHTGPGGVKSGGQFVSKFDL